MKDAEDTLHTVCTILPVSVSVCVLRAVYLVMKQRAGRNIP